MVMMNLVKLIKNVSKIKRRLEQTVVNILTTKSRFFHPSIHHALFIHTLCIGYGASKVCLRVYTNVKLLLELTCISPNTFNLI